MDYKETLLLPKTEFEMRGNLAKKEPLILEKWEKENIYAQMMEAHKDAEPFIYHDGPPYANGNIHIGHALNKTIKDIIVRSHYKMGYFTPFIPGWDTHGLPIENAIQKTGVNRKEMSVAAFRKLCEEYAHAQVAMQMKDLKRLGTVADYDHPYLTLAPDYEEQQIRIFGAMAMKGMIYQGLKPVYWSPSSESALAEAEIEYYDKKDPTIYVAFDVIDGKGLVDGDRFVIWTTTPWTIPANLAICLNPDLEYAVVKTAKGNLIMLNSRVDDLMKIFKLDDYQIIKTMPGRDLEYVTTKHPFYDRESLVILGAHVTDEAGTGCVHTAPDHGIDDFNIGMKYGLEPFEPVDEEGRLRKVTGEFLAGQTVDEANKTVTQKLDELGNLLALEWITHSYPHDWRTKKPIIFRATTQWFASIELIRKDLLREIDKVEWKPSWGKLRMHNMIKDRGDWCISRQRVWGVPIPIFYCEDGSPIIDKAVFDHVAELFGRYGSNIWFEREAKDLLPEGFTHPNSPNHRFTKEKDIMDVWFDSGSSHTAALAKYGVTLPVDLYMEGSDQYRGWFNSSLIVSTAVFGTAPYKKIVSHGFILKDDGNKMSKSSGDALKPNAIFDQLGADILRLWVATVDYTADAPLSQEILKQVTENYRKIRNTFRFMHGNLNGFTEADLVDVQDLPAVDRYVLNEVTRVNREGIEAYRTYEYADVQTKVSTLLINVMSAYYLDFTKDILYIEKEDSLRRRQVQTVLYHSLDILVRLMAPILVYTTEELYSIFKPDAQSVHVLDFSNHVGTHLSMEEEADFKRLFEIREEVFKVLEVARADKVIGKALEAEVVLHLNESDTALLNRYFEGDLAQWLIVSKVSFTQHPLELVRTIEAKVQRVEGHVCERCWNIVDHLQDGVCERCYHVLHD